MTRQPRPPGPERVAVPWDVAEWLQQARADVLKREAELAKSRENLATLLARAHRDGDSFRALAEVVGLSWSQVRSLVGQGSQQPS